MASNRVYSVALPQEMVKERKTQVRLAPGRKCFRLCGGRRPRLMRKMARPAAPSYQQMPRSYPWLQAAFHGSADADHGEMPGVPGNTSRKPRI